MNDEKRGGRLYDTPGSSMEDLNRFPTMQELFDRRKMYGTQTMKLQLFESGDVHQEAPIVDIGANIKLGACGWTVYDKSMRCTSASKVTACIEFLKERLAAAETETVQEDFLLKPGDRERIGRLEMIIGAYVTVLNSRRDPQLAEYEAILSMLERLSKAAEAEQLTSRSAIG